MKIKRQMPAWLLCLCLLAALLPVTALAESGSQTVDPAQLQTEKQIVKSSETAAEWEILENGSVQINERVLPTGTENQFEIQMDVTTTEDVSLTQASGNTAVAIMVDKSSSMNQYSPIILDSSQYQAAAEQFSGLAGLELPYETAYAGGKLTEVDAVLDTCAELSSEARQAVYNCYHRRAWFERKAIIDFLDAYTQDIPEGTHRYFALAAVHGSASTKIAWTEVNAHWREADLAGVVLEYNGEKTEPWNTETSSGKYVYGNYTTYTSGSGSNIEGAYILADNLINDIRTREDIPAENSCVFMITDGEPTKQARDPNSASTERIDGASLSGGAYGSAQLENIGKRADSGGYTMNIVWYGNSTLENSIYNLPNGQENYADIFFDVGTTEKIYNLEISNTFTEMTKKFTRVDPWLVSAELDTRRFSYDGVTAASPSPDSAVSFDGDVLRWDLKKCTPEVLSDGFYHYRLNYRVTLDNTTGDFVPEQPYDTNSAAALSYTVTKNNLFSSLRTAVFDVPQVCGYLGDVKLNKTDASGKALPGARFRLGNAELGSREAVSDSTQVCFASVPSGRSYTLEEISAPEGYEKDAAVHQAEIRYGTVSFDGSAQTLTVVNAPVSPETTGAAEPVTPTTAPVSTNQNPSTGDAAPMALRLALLLVSGAGILTAAAYGKKRGV